LQAGPVVRPAAALVVVLRGIQFGHEGPDSSGSLGLSVHVDRIASDVKL
jgi:hypothetical protein